jgi:hypothetical protein
MRRGNLLFRIRAAAAALPTHEQEVANHDDFRLRRIRVFAATDPFGKPVKKRLAQEAR